MWTSNTANENLETVNNEPSSFSGERILATAAGTLKRAINKNPEMALLISASIGVLLGCLIKRR
jgi:ElaB/YqjD/DUF883 family membrane-anchored ribosome-binding protein